MICYKMYVESWKPNLFFFCFLPFCLEFFNLFQTILQFGYYFPSVFSWFGSSPVHQILLDSLQNSQNEIISNLTLLFFLSSLFLRGSIARWVTLSIIHLHMISSIFGNGDSSFQWGVHEIQICLHLSQTWGSWPVSRTPPISCHIRDQKIELSGRHPGNKTHVWERPRHSFSWITAGRPSDLGFSS